MPVHAASIGSRAFVLFPGLAACAIVALAAAFLAGHYGGPTILFALLLGMALQSLSDHPAMIPGIRFTSGALLRFGVALLGARITFEQVTALGWSIVAIVVAAVIATLAFGLLLSRLMGRKWTFGVLTGGSVAICGASAAVAIASVLPHDEDSDRTLVFTVVGVTTLSTVAMVLYPIVVSALGLDERAAGLFLGGAIHDVAQVVGAGYAISDTVGDNATVVKLLRVSMLLPVVFVLSLIVRHAAQPGVRAPVPYFLLGFAAIATLNSFGVIPEPVRAALTGISRWCLVAAIAAVGVRTVLTKLMQIGGQAVTMIVLETLFVAALVLGLASI
jgi:uncharacterized integral membrane protein (TIGR00698 family)